MPGRISQDLQSIPPTLPPTYFQLHTPLSNQGGIFKTDARFPHFLLIIPLVLTVSYPLEVPGSSPSELGKPQKTFHQIGRPPLVRG